MQSFTPCICFLCQSSGVECFSTAVLKCKRAGVTYCCLRGVSWLCLLFKVMHLLKAFFRKLCPSCDAHNLHLHLFFFLFMPFQRILSIFAQRHQSILVKIRFSGALVIILSSLCKDIPFSQIVCFPG